MTFQVGHQLRKVHGHTSGSGKNARVSRTYQSWHCMKLRCLRSYHKHFKDYGGRGIKICRRWMSFANFLADMGVRPAGKTLDRWPNRNGNYTPRNCRWATPKQQAEGRRPLPPFSREHRQHISEAAKRREQRRKKI